MGPDMLVKIRLQVICGDTPQQNPLAQALTA